MALSGIRSPLSLGASIDTRARLNQLVGPLPALPANQVYQSAWVRPTIDATGQPTQYEADIASGLAQGIRVVELPPEPSLFDRLKSIGSIFGGIIAAPFTGGSSLLGTLATVVQEGSRPGFQSKPLGSILPVRTTMGLFDDIWGGIQSTASTLFPTNQGIDWNNILNQGIGLATTALTPRGVSQGFTPPTVQPAMMAAAPAIARAGALVGRGFFNRFPNLATAIQGLRNSGMNVTRSKLYGVMKRFGPEFLVTGGLLTAAAVNELAVAGPGYRRMNPANVRALRRSVRRIESFHRLCTTTDRLRGRGARRRKC